MIYRGLVVCIALLWAVAAGSAAREPATKAPIPPEVDPVASLDIIYRRTDVSGERLELGLTDVIELALRNNFDIQIERLNVPINELAAIEERAVFDPVFGTLFNYRQSVIQAVTALQGAPIPEERKYDLDFSLGQALPTGGSYTFLFENERLRTNNIFVPLDPRYDVWIRLDISQPLLRDFGIDVNTTSIRQAENEIKIAEESYRGQMIDAIANAINTYWELVYTIMDLQVREVSLSQAMQLLEENRAKFKAGTLPRTDVLQAEAGVANRRTNILLIRAIIENTEDQLKQALNIEAERGPEAWDLPIAPQTPPAVVDIDVTPEHSLELARHFRPDYQQFLLAVDNDEIELRYRRNQLWPDLNLRVSGQLAGVGGTPRPDAIIDENVGRGYRAAFDNATSGKYYSLEAGVMLEIPLGNRARKSAFRAAKLELRQRKLEFERFKQEILVEVRRAIRQLRTARAEIRSTDILRKAQWKKLQAERRRYEVGKTTSFEVLIFQEQFAVAQRQYVRSVIGYNQAFVNLQRAQGTLLKHLNIQVTY